MADRRIKLGQTNEFRYIGVMPPLSDEELEAFLIVPTNSDEVPVPYKVIENDGSMTLGFDASEFGEFGNLPTDIGVESSFVQYCSQAAERLGGISLDTTLHYANPGSMFTPDSVTT